MIKETCSCGATFESDDAPTRYRDERVETWRVTHIHEMPVMLPSGAPVIDPTPRWQDGGPGWWQYPIISFGLPGYSLAAVANGAGQQEQAESSV